MRNRKPFPAFKDSPAFKYFSHWILDTGRINGIDASIDFESEIDEFGDMVIKNVAVTFFPDRRMRELKYKDHPLREEQKADYRGYSHSGVASLCDVDGRWMKKGNVMPPPELSDETGSCLGYSPDGDFAWFRYYGFINIDYAKKAVEQFAFIDECEWARDGSIDIAALVKTYTEEEIQDHQIKQIEDDIKSHEYGKKEKVFDRIVNEKIATGEWVVPEGVSICGTGLMIFIDAAHWDKNAPVNVLQRQIEELRKQIFGE